MSEGIALRYVGPRYVIGVPAADITVDPDEAARLVATGCYIVEADAPTPDAASDPDTAGSPESDTAEDDVPAQDEDVDDVPVGE